jgi:hypothetical protein
MIKPSKCPARRTEMVLKKSCPGKYPERPKMIRASHMFPETAVFSACLRVERAGFWAIPPACSRTLQLRSDPPYFPLVGRKLHPSPPCASAQKRSRLQKKQILRLAHNINRLRVARFDKYWVWNPRGAEGKLSILWSPITHLYGLFMQCNELQDATHCKVELPSAESKFQKQNYLMQVT